MGSEHGARSNGFSAWGDCTRPSLQGTRLEGGRLLQAACQNEHSSADSRAGGSNLWGILSPMQQAMGPAGAVLGCHAGHAGVSHTEPVLQNDPVGRALTVCDLAFVAPENTPE